MRARSPRGESRRDRSPEAHLPRARRGQATLALSAALKERGLPAVSVPAPHEEFTLWARFLDAQGRLPSGPFVALATLPLRPRDYQPISAMSAGRYRVERQGARAARAASASRPARARPRQYHTSSIWSVSAMTWSGG